MKGAHNVLLLEVTHHCRERRDASIRRGLRAAVLLKRIPQQNSRVSLARVSVLRSALVLVLVLILISVLVLVVGCACRLWRHRALVVAVWVDVGGGS